MYEQYFGLSEKPFTLNPDPDFLYLSKNHARALSILEYGVASEAGVVVITGEVGAGKTTLIRHLLTQLDDAHTVGLITNTHKSFGQLINWVSMAFGLPHEGKDKVALYNQFVDFMIGEYAEGRRVVIIVDEAQNMDRDTLEELRVISNINADKDLVMQLILAGQPEFRETLRSPGMEQFVQRVAAYYHLSALDADAVAEYVKHRWTKAGGDPDVFSDGALHLIYTFSKGVPRMINTLTNLALTYAFAEQKKTVDASVVEEVLRDRNDHGLFGAGMVIDDRPAVAGTKPRRPVRAVPSEAETEEPGASSVERYVELSAAKQPK